MIGGCTTVVSAQIDTFQVGIVYPINHSPGQSEFDNPPLLLNTGNTCGSIAKIVIDLYTQNVPDSFYIKNDTFPGSPSLIHTPSFGASCTVVPAFADCVQGFMSVTVDGWVQTNSLPIFPQHAIYGTGAPGTFSIRSLGRMTLYTDKQHLYFFSVPNVNYPTYYEFYLHPLERVNIVNTVYIHNEVIVCEDSLEAFEIIDNPAKYCDTVWISGLLLDQELPSFTVVDTLVPINTVIDVHFPNGEVYKHEIIRQDTTFWLDEITSAGCYYEMFYNARVYGQVERLGIFIPNAFSPNGDGYNDYFYPLFRIQPDTYSMTIFDRWGGTLYKGRDKWDGGDKNPGVYVYLIDTQYGTYTHKYKGSITLLK